MPNPKFYYTDLTTQTFISSVGDDTEFPSTNLNNYVPASIWKSINGSSMQYLAIDFGSSGKTRKAIVIDNHNLAGIMASGTIKIQMADDNLFTVNLTDVDSNFVPVTGVCIKEFAASGSKRYWRLLFNGTLNYAPSIGNLFVDEFLDFGYGYEYPYVAGDRAYETVERTALDGTFRASQVYAGRMEFEIQFKFMNDTFKSNFQSFHSTVRGKMMPFYFLDTSGTSVYYVKLDSDRNPIESVAYQFHHTAKLKLKSFAVL